MDLKQTYQKSASNSSSYTTVSSQASKANVTVAHVVTDDGAGNLYGTFGTVGYVAKSVTVKVVGDYSETSYQSNYENAAAWENLNATGAAGDQSAAAAGGGGSTTAKGGAYGTTVQAEHFGNSGLIVRYKTGIATPQAVTETFTPPGIVIDLCPMTKDYIVPGSVRFTWMGTVYDDFEGKIYRGRSDSNPGTESGTIDYVAGLVTMTDYVVAGSPTSLTVQSLWTRKPPPPTANITFQVALAPVKPAGMLFSCLDIAGNQVIGTSAIDGMITGPHIRGKIDYETGLTEIQFGDYVLDASLTAADKAEWWYSAGEVGSDGKIWRPWAVDASSLRYNAVTYAYLPLDASIIGVDPVRLPQDGRVPIFRPGYFAVLGHTGVVGPQAVANNQVVDCGRVRLSRVRVIGNDGRVIGAGYSADLEAGTVTFSDVSGYAQPVRIEHRIEDMAMISDVQINGDVTFTRQISHAYPADAYLSSAIVASDLMARVSVLFDQATWNGAFADAIVGSAATATFNDVLAPIEVSNAGAVTERWCIQFTNTTSFSVIGEHVGVIAVGNTAADCAPVNPATGKPYFTVRALGWGAGWAAGNVLRFNTVGAIAPVWVVRTIQQGAETVTNDSFTLLIRGDVDRP